MLRFIFTVVFLFLTATMSFAQTTLELDYKKNYATMVISPEEYNSWVQNDDFSKHAKLQEMTKRVYEKFNDDFDFIFYISNEKTLPSSMNYYGKYVPVSNGTSGIGRTIFNNADLFGSAGKLQGIMHIPYRPGLKNGPTLHEFMHRWGNYALQTGIYDPSTGTPNNNFGSHWGFTGGSTPGQLGGFSQSSLLTNVNGDPNRYSVSIFGMNANGGNSVPYNKLELYLMGMIPASEVTAFDLFRDITSVTAVDDRYVFVAGTRETYNGNDLITKLGARVPNHSSAQKDFKVLFVTVSGAPLNESDWSEVSFQVNWFAANSNDTHREYNFYEATEGNGTINISDLASSLKVGTSDQITIKTPNDGTSIKWGTSTSITWETTITGNVKIDLIQDGVLKQNLTAGVSASSGSFSWTPDVSLLGENYRIKITSLTNPDINDYSDNTFLIEDQYYKLSGTVKDENNVPVRNAILALGDPVTIDQIQKDAEFYYSLSFSRREQSFKPNGDYISKVDLYLFRADQATKNVIVEIADSLGTVLGRDTILNSEIVGRFTVASALFVPAVPVSPGKKYLLRVASDGNGFSWGASSENPYPLGQADQGINFDYSFVSYQGDGVELKTNENGQYQIMLNKGYSGVISLLNLNTLYEASGPITISNLASDLPGQNFILKGPVVISGYVRSSTNIPLGFATVSWGEPLLTDQSQTAFSTGYDVSRRELGQTFIPTISSLSEVQLFLTKTNTAVEPVTVKIKKGGDVIGMQILGQGSFNKASNWVSVPFMPPLSLIPGEEYEITASVPAGNLYYWYGDSAVYDKGTATGISDPYFDFCFKTQYGIGGAYHTDNTGYYEFRFPTNWSGEIHAMRDGYNFYPKRFSNIITSLSDQDFIDGVISSVRDVSNSANTVTVFPNPTTDQLTIKVSPDENLRLAEILGADGALIANYSLFFGNEQIINVSSLNSGWYILRITSNKKTYTTKINKL